MSDRLAHARAACGRFIVDSVARKLLVDGESVRIGARAFDLLCALLRHRSEVVAKDKLIEAVWPNVFVEENNLEVQISALRKLLGAEAIATVAGRGYKLALDDAALVLHRQADATATTPTPVGSHNLPQPDNELIGREVDCDVLVAELRTTRVLTVVGPAGIGKTRVALSVAWQVTERFADGVWWVDLAALASPDRLADIIATATGHPLGPGDATTSLVSALRHRRMLLVLDNCEHLTTHVASLLHRVLEVAPELQVLATSQSPLQLGAEHCFRIEPLALPAEGTANEVARCAPAVALLLERARAIDRRFVVEDEWLPLAISLCRELDGLPLAIELAAARLPALGLRELHGMLHQRLELLKSPRADIPRHHRALDAALDWSCALLSPEELDALQHLSVFSASFRLASALEVIDAATAPEGAGILSSLVAKSLVLVDPRQPIRYRLLESTRIHAARGLRQSGNADATTARWRVAMARLARECEHGFWVSSDASWLRAIGSDQPDLVAAFEHCASAGELELAGDLGQAAHLLDYMQNIGGAVQRRRKIASSLLQALDPGTVGESRCSGLLNVVTFFSEYQPQKPHELKRALEHRLMAWRQRGDPWQVYRALGALAMRYSADHDTQGARQLLSEAQKLSSPSWPPRLLAAGAYATAFVRMLERDASSYRDSAATMLQLCRVAGAPQEDLRARLMMADAQVLAGQHAEALAILEALATEAESSGQVFGHVMGLILLCFAHLLSGDTERARAIAERALPCAREHFFSDVLLGGAALIGVRMGQFELAALALGSWSQRRPDSSSWWANEWRLCEITRTELEAALPPRRLIELLDQGAELDRHQRWALMQQSFAQTA